MSTDNISYHQHDESPCESTIPVHQPDYNLPDTSPPRLQAFDLTTPGINYIHELEPDTSLAFRPDDAQRSRGQRRFWPSKSHPNLHDYTKNLDLDIQSNDARTTDPIAPGLELDEVSGKLTLYHDPLSADPLLPDLQQPQLTPEVQMTARPGDLDENALQQMHQSATYQQLGNVPYTQVFIDQSGMNTARRRHFDLLMRGLDAEEA